LRMQNDKTLLGVTGGIGSGKTLVCKFLEQMGCSVYYADNIAKNLYRKNKVLKRRLVKAFGDGILDKRRNIALLELRKLVFSSKLNQQRVGQIVHPFVISEIIEKTQRNPHRFIVVEAALIFESHFDKYLDYTILVHSDVKAKIKRIVERDKITKSEVRRILKLQMPEREKIKRADFIVDNNGRIAELQKNVGRVFEKIKQHSV
jgi:dephospho-CoA kinase